MGSSFDLREKTRKPPPPQKEPADKRPDLPGQDENSMLYWQRTIGNQAVQRMFIQRDPDDTKANAKSTGGPQGITRPGFFRTTPGGELPGEAVPEMSTWQPPYTQANRQFLLDQLLKRNETNATNGLNFANRFSSSYLKIWSGYILDQMEDAAKSDSSFWGELATFLVKAAVVAIMTVPVLGELEEAGMAVAELYKKTTEFSVELAVNQGKEKEAEGKVAKRKQKMEKETDIIADQFASELTTIIQPTMTGFYYTEWLEEANPDDLPKFRLPPLFPDKSKAEIDAAVAQSLGGFFNQNEDSDEDLKSSIVMAFSDAPVGFLSVEQAPVYHGPKFLGERLINQSIELMPNIPLEMYITIGLNYELGEIIKLKGMYNSGDIPAMMSILPEGAKQMDDIKKIADAWPLKPPMTISRNDDGTIYPLGGGLAEMLYVYQFAHPDENLYQTILKYTQGMDEPFQRVRFTEDPEECEMGEDDTSKTCNEPQIEVEPEYTNTEAAQELIGYLNPGVQEGARKLVLEHVIRMPVTEIREND